MPKQTSLKDVRVRTRETVDHASFVFPFFDALLDVRFLLMNIRGGHFLLYETPHWERRILTVSERRLVPINEAHPDLFHRYFHFDPWWTMRGATSVAPAVRQAVIASNVAARQHNQLVIRDVVFRQNLDQVEEVRVGDGVFRAVSYNQARPMPWTMQEAFFSRNDVGQSAGG